MRKRGWTIFLLLSIGLQTHAMTIDSLSQIADQFTSPTYKIKISKIPKDWHMTNSSLDDNLLALFRNDQKPDLVLSLRVDNLERFPSTDPNLKKYIRYYTKKYPRAGLELVNLPSKSIFGHYANLEIHHKGGEKSSQQTILWHPEKKVLIFTCTGKIENSQKNYAKCSEIISRMQWL